ncbi:MAG: sulfurtransferase TusA family protein [Bacillota bacterium]|nr:sulfurtransferase TusA family protein [Bacillota bacterium]
MTKNNSSRQAVSSCCCPFCDDPTCPDEGEGKYSCKNEEKVALHHVDCIGLYCPVPVMMAREEIESLEKGKIMELVADDPASAEDIPRWAKRAGHSLLAVKKEGEIFRFLIQKEKEERTGD